MLPGQENIHKQPAESSSGIKPGCQLISFKPKQAGLSAFICTNNERLECMQVLELHQQQQQLHAAPGLAGPDWPNPPLLHSPLLLLRVASVLIAAAVAHKNSKNLCCCLVTGSHKKLGSSGSRHPAADGSVN